MANLSTVTVLKLDGRARAVLADNFLELATEIGDDVIKFKINEFTGNLEVFKNNHSIWECPQDAAQNVDTMADMIDTVSWALTLDLN